MSKCARCDNADVKGVLYKCCRCFTVYCVACPDTKEGTVCPKCGMSARLVIDAKE